MLTFYTCSECRGQSAVWGRHWAWHELYHMGLVTGVIYWLPFDRSVVGHCEHFHRLHHPHVDIRSDHVLHKCRFLHLMDQVQVS